jgi:hypothetical protein
MALAIKAIALFLLFNSISAVAKSVGRNPISVNEHWVENQIRKGSDADLEGKEISADFLVRLLKNSGSRGNIPSYGVRLSNAIVTGDLNLENISVPTETRLIRCRFTGAVNFYQSDFQKSLSLEESTFENSLILQRATVAGNLWAGNIKIKNNAEVSAPAVSFDSLRVGDSLILSNAIFERGAIFYRMSVDSGFYADEAQFVNKDEEVNFDGIHVAGSLSFNKIVFEGSVILANATINQLECTETKFNRDANFYNLKVNEYASFANASFGGLANFESIDIAKDLDLTKAQFNSPSDTISFFSMKVGGNAIFFMAKFSGGFSLIKADIAGNLDFSFAQATKPNSDKSFAGTKVDTAIFDGATIVPHYMLNGVSYRLIGSDSNEHLISLIDQSDYSPDTYTTLEAYFRRMGFNDVADDTYVAGRERERDENFRGHHISYLPKYLWSWVLYIVVGYGKHLARALLWSLILIGIGIFIFRKEDYMMIRDEKDIERYKNKYHPVWYSLALFLPIVELEDAKIWAPRMDRKWSRFYMRLHIILGYLLIPIGLAAWTGLIK